MPIHPVNLICILVNVLQNPCGYFARSLKTCIFKWHGGGGRIDVARFINF